MKNRRTRRQTRRLWGLFPLIWLIWLIYPIQAFTARPHPLGETLLFWSTLLAFIGLYARTFMPERPDDRWAYAGWLAALLMWLLGLTLYGASAFTFLIYGASLIGWQRRMTVALLGAGLNGALMLGSVLSGTGEAGDLIFTLFALVAAYGNHASYHSHLARLKLAEVQREKEKLAADAERERIARDLHDLLGHTLSVIVLKSELAGKLAGRNPERAAEEIRDVERISREALQEVRAAVRGYRGSGLSAELARAKVALDTAGVKLTVMDAIPALPEGTESNASMLLREAVTNVVRHAQASEVRVTLRAAPQGHTLIVQDDGVGGKAAEGTGLNSMRERLRALGGTLERDGRQGTTLVAFFPDPTLRAPQEELALRVRRPA